MSTIKDFIFTIFDQNDCIWINNGVKGYPSSCPIQYWDYDHLSGFGSDIGVFFVLHPASGDQKSRKKDNSKGLYRNIMIEFDDISIEEQKKLVKELEIPYTSAVYSGGKSIHYIISLEQALTYKEYLIYFNFIQELTNCDSANKCQVRYSRLPFCFRGEVEQKLLELNKRIPNKVFEDWITSPNIIKVRMLNTAKRRTELRKKKRAKTKTTHDGDLVREDLVQWYVEEYLEVDGSGSSFNVQCPVCCQDGHDANCDNMIVNLPDYTYRCFFDPDEHNRRMLPTINKLMNPKPKQTGKRKGAY